MPADKSSINHAVANQIRSTSSSTSDSLDSVLSNIAKTRISKLIQSHPLEQLNTATSSLESSSSSSPPSSSLPPVFTIGGGSNKANNQNTVDSPTPGIYSLSNFTLSTLQNNINQLITQKLDEIVMTNTKVLFFGIVIGAAISAGIGVGLLAASSALNAVPTWCGRAYRLCVRNHFFLWNRKGRANSSSTTAKTDIERKENDCGKNGENIRGATIVSESKASIPDDETKERSRFIKERMGQSSSELEDNIKCNENNFAILGRASSPTISTNPRTIDTTTAPNTIESKVIVIQGKPQQRHPTDNEATSSSTSSEINQCRQCLDSITENLIKHNLSWTQNVGRITAHMVIGKCKSSTFRSVLQDYPLCSENTVISIYFVQQLEDESSVIEVDVLASS